MAKSMTGYGRSELGWNGRKFTVEIKSVNNRYLDINIRMPRQFNPFEAQLRALLKDYITRGKVDVYISFEDLSGDACRMPRSSFWRPESRKVRLLKATF